MSRYEKRDRTARLNRIAQLLYENRTSGMTAAEIARRIDMTVRTVYRDLHALEGEIGIPLWQEGNRWGCESKSFLPPLKLTLHEGVALFLSARLMARYADKRSQRSISAFAKLSAVLPAPVAKQVDATIAELSKLPEEGTYESILDLLATAWAEQRKVRISYPWAARDGQTTVYQRTVSPYFLEPNPAGHSCYLMGHDAYANALRVFKVERIREAQLTDETFDTPDGFDIAERLRQAWGVADQDPVEVRLLVSEPGAIQRIRESRWHPSQVATELGDGRLEVRYVVSGTLEILPWILGWGSAVEVLEPPALREKVAEVGQEMARLYSDVGSAAVTT